MGLIQSTKAPKSRRLGSTHFEKLKALFRRLKFAVRRHKFHKDSLLRPTIFFACAFTWGGGTRGRHHHFGFRNIVRLAREKTSLKGLWKVMDSKISLQALREQELISD